MAKTRQISFRIPEDEYQRIMRVFERAKERTMGYAPLGDVVRELIGTCKPKLTTEEDRQSVSWENAFRESEQPSGTEMITTSGKRIHRR